MQKKIKIAVLAGAGVLLAGTGIWFGAKKFSKSVVDVYSISELSQPIWGESSQIDGSISSHVSQDVRLMDKQIVSKVHVQEGQEVKEGDPLLTYDMTLVNIDLEMEKLNKQKLEIKKKGLEQQLKSLKKGKMISTFDMGNYKLEKLAQQDLPQGIGQNVDNPQTLTEPDTNPPTDPTTPPGGETPTDPTTPPGGETPTDPTTPPGGETPTDPTIPPGGEIPTDPTTPPGGETPDPPVEEPKSSPAYKRLYWDVSLNPTPPEDGAVVEPAVYFDGLGTKESPYRFLCTKGVLIQGAFLNHIAGFDANGEKTGIPMYCLLEVHSEDTQDGLLLAAMQLDGSALEKPVQADLWFRTKLGKNEWEEMPQGGADLPGGMGGFVPGGSIIGGYSKEELKKAIADKEREIATAGLDIRQSDIKIKKVEQKLQDETICSTVDGIVTKVGDPAKGEIDGEPFITVESTGGVYVQGRVSEDMLEKVKAGQVLTGVAYESGMPFEAEVKEVSQFPTNNNYYYGGSKEVSYYPFTAYIQNAEGLKDNEMVTMDMPQTDGAITGIFVSKEYVRSKDGEDFVYKEGKNGRLEKQVVKTGKVFYGYLVEIKEGITEEDYLAFPYGKKVKNGAKVKRSTLAELYNMY